MTTDPDDKYGEILRRALHAEAARVEPAPDGLERIRAGIEQRSRRRLSRLQGWAPPFWLPGGWSRPLLAVAVTVLVVAVGVSAPQTIERISSAGRHGPAEDSGTPSAAAAGQGAAHLPGQAPHPPGQGHSLPPASADSPVSQTPGVSPSPTCPPAGRPTDEASLRPAPGDPQHTPPQCPQERPSPTAPEPEETTPTPPEEPPSTPSEEPPTPTPTDEPETTEEP